MAINKRKNDNTKKVINYKHIENEDSKENVIKFNEKKSYEDLKENVSIYERYVRFFKKHMKKNIIKYFIIGIVLFALLITNYVNLLKNVDFTINDISIGKHLFEKLKINSLMLLTSLVPYLYIPVIAFFVADFVEIGNVATIIALEGYKLGLLKMIIPFLLITLSYAILTSHAMFLFKMSQISFKLSNLNSMNFTVFRIRFLEMIRKNEKAEQLTKKHMNKKQELENKKEKINYLNILITFIIATVIQLIAICIYKIVI